MCGYSDLYIKTLIRLKRSRELETGLSHTGRLVYCTDHVLVCVSSHVMKGIQPEGNLDTCAVFLKLSVFFINSTFSIPLSFQ